MSRSSPPWDTFKRPTCRGSYALGTACGKCEKCEWERKQMRPAPQDNSNHDQSKPKWTPGPWRAYFNAVQAAGSVDTYSGSVWGTIAHAKELAAEDMDGRVWSASGSAKANAHLIASAPELYQELDIALNALRSYQYGNCSPNLAEKCADRIEIALAKARGEDQ